MSVSCTPLVVILIFIGVLPISITVLFGLMAYHNIQQLAHYTIPLVRRELDKQLTIMVLIQVLIDFFVLFPYTIVNALTVNTNISNDPLVQAQIQLSYNITIILYYTHLAVSIDSSDLTIKQRNRHSFLFEYF